MINPLIFLPLLLKKKKKGLKAVNIDHPLNLPNISEEMICVFNCNWLNKYKHRGWLLPRVDKGGQWLAEVLWLREGRVPVVRAELEFLLFHSTISYVHHPHPIVHNRHFLCMSHFKLSLAEHIETFCLAAQD